MSKNLYLYDFDGTIAAENSFIDFIEWYSGKVKTKWSQIVLAPMMYLFPSSKRKRRCKTKLLRRHFDGTSEKEFNRLCKNYAFDRLPEIIMPNALHSIKEHIEAKGDVYVVSSSLPNYIKPYFNHHDVEVIGSDVAFINNKITLLVDCSFEEKVNKIKEKIDLTQYKEIHVYGNSDADEAMMRLGTHTYYQLFELEGPD